MAETRQEKMTVDEKQKESLLRYRCDTARIAAVKKGSVALLALMTIAFVMTGSYSCESMGDIAVLISWALYLVPLLFSWAGIFTFLRIGEFVTARQKKKGPERLLQSSAFAAMLSAASVFCCVYFLITGEYASVTREIGMLIRVMIQCLLAVGLTALSRYHMLQLEESN